MDKLDVYLQHHRACNACKPANSERPTVVLCRYARKLWSDYRHSARSMPSLPPAPSTYPLGGLDESGWEG